MHQPVVEVQPRSICASAGVAHRKLVTCPRSLMSSAIEVFCRPKQPQLSAGLMCAGQVQGLSLPSNKALRTLLPRSSSASTKTPGTAAHRIERHCR